MTNQTKKRNKMVVEIEEEIIEKLKKKHPDCEWDCYNIREAILTTILYFDNLKKCQKPKN